MSGVSGLNQLAEVARTARLAGGELTPKIKRGIAKIGPPAKQAVIASAEEKLPHRGGYADLMAKSLKVRVKTDLGFTTAGVTIVTYASGKGERRDVVAVNRGILRHPVWGHRRRAWVAQKIKSGFWDDAMQKVENDAYERVREVVDETARTLKG